MMTSRFMTAIDTLTIFSVNRPSQAGGTGGFDVEYTHIHTAE